MLLLITKSGEKPEVFMFSSTAQAKRYVIQHILDTMPSCHLPMSEAVLMLKTIVRVLRAGIPEKGFQQITRACYNTGYRYAFTTESCATPDPVSRDLLDEAEKMIAARDKFGLRNLRRPELFDILSEVHGVLSGGAWDSDTGQRIADILRSHDIVVGELGDT